MYTATDYPFKDDINPNFKTPEEDFDKKEHVKLESDGVRGQLYNHFRDLSSDDIAWESEQLAKSHGIYLQWNRAKTGKEKDWMYMVRITIPGGGPLTREQWRVFDDVAEDYTTNPEGNPSLRVTTRQNIQFHWVKKKNLVDLVRRIAETGFYSLNGCGDNVRNVMGCPVSSHSTLYNAHAMANRSGRYFRLPAEAHIAVIAVDPKYMRTPDERFKYGRNLLNRKFKIGFSAIHFDEASGRWVPDNCVELRAHDIGVAPVLDNGEVKRFQVYIGGGQGEKNRKPTISALGEPIGIFRKENLLKGLDAIVRIHQEWGDRQNRYWARLKYVLLKMGMEWFQNEVRSLKVEFEPPDPRLDYGDRDLHHGWMRQPSNGLFTYGAFIENGRIIDGPNGEMKTMVRHLMETYPIKLMNTPNQHLLFTDIPEEAREDFEADMRRFGYGKVNGKPYSTLRKSSVACVGLNTCGLAFTDSEKFLPSLIGELEALGFGDLKESIGMSGCEAQCSRPATKAIGWVGSAKNRYQLKLMGAEDGRHQGLSLSDSSGKYYLILTPREEVLTVTKTLFQFYLANRNPGETLGYFHQRTGMEAIIEHLKQDPETTELMKKTYNHPNRA
ncbi:MAG: nitrite/sulfite reductase [Nitrospinae bacterium]|nr:nitrite/sulfite reductase [Nitrospinota bacterium]